MLSKLKKSDAKGFTIIEVMIVLALAGFILVIVLLAVPALNRNSRNTAMKNDATAVASAITEFRSNNDGRLPNQAPAQSGADWSIGASFAGAVAADVKLQEGTTLVYRASNAAPAAYTTATASTIYYVSGAKCTSTNYTANTDVDVTAGSARSVAVIYPVERRTGAPLGKCLDT